MFYLGWMTALPADVTAAVASVPIGIARAAVRIFKDLAKSKRSSYSPQLLGEHPTAQRELGRAELHMRSAEVLLFHAIGAILAAIACLGAFETGGEIDIHEERQIGLEAAASNPIEREHGVGAEATAAALIRKRGIREPIG